MDAEFFKGAFLGAIVAAIIILAAIRFMFGSPEIVTESNDGEDKDSETGV